MPTEIFVILLRPVSDDTSNDEEVSNDIEDLKKDPLTSAPKGHH